jgi:hypothetical protein
MRRLIVQTFEAICLAMVVIPTLAGIVWVFAGNRGDTLLWTVGVFIFTSFLAGGALTLVDIANNTKGCMEALRDMRDRLRATQEAPAAPRRPAPGGTS